MRLSHDEYMSAVNAKINAAKDDLMKAGNNDLVGFSNRVDRLSKSAENLYFSMGDDCFDPVHAAFTYFSNKPGLNDVTNVAAVDIIDIGIQATRQSVMGYLTVERAMDKPVDIAWYQTLIALNNAGGYTKDEQVFSPFSPISPKINLGPTSQTIEFTSADWTGGDDGKTYTLTFSGATADKPLVARSIKLVVLDGDTEVATAADLKGMDEATKTGTLYWDVANICKSATINYETGVITVVTNEADALNSLTVKVTANIERTAQKSGANTLKVKPKTTTIQLVAKPNRIILENSFEENAYMNKQAFNLAQKGIQLDFGKRAINQLLQTFVAYLDFTSVAATWDAASKTAQNTPVTELDLTDYLLSSSQAATKYDFINQAMLKLNDDLLVRTGKGATCWLVDSEAARVLGNCQAHFTANPTLTSNLDGVVGTYMNLPVIRHHVLNGVVDQALYAGKNQVHGLVIAVFKSDDGQAGPTMYGEYLPPLTSNKNLGGFCYIAA